MLRSLCQSSTSCLIAKGVRLGMPLLALGLLSCSADVTRFNSPLLGASETTTGSIERADDTARYDDRLSAQSPPARGRTVGGTYRDAAVSTRVAPLSGTTNTTSDAQRTANNRRGRQLRVADAAPRYADAGSGRLGSNSIVVRNGDTLYGLARTHGTTVAAIKSANGLTTDTIRPGQSLVLPGSSSVVPQSQTRTAAPSRNQRAPASTGDGRTYTVQSGDSLYKIARKTGVSVADLKQLNDIQDVRRIMPGTVLRLRDGGAVASRAPDRTRRSGRDVNVRSSRTVDIRTDARSASTDSRDRVDTRRPASRSNSQTSLLTPKTPSSQPAARNGVVGATFAWPLRGRVVSGFGPRADNTHNDGLDIAVPIGTDVRAADAGVVAYAGSELKAYGNLVLIRHDNGWVSAYAHADQLVVKRGDSVARGQVIAKSGQTGSVDRPMLHFELREGAKPVDPMPLLPKIN